MFFDFNEEQYRLLAFGSQKLTFPKGTRVFQDGQTTDGGYAIIRGKIELVASGSDHIIGTFGAGDLIGQMAILTRNHRIGTAVVVEDCELMKISRATVHRILGEYPELAVRLHERITRNVGAMAKNLDEIQAKMRKIDEN